MAQKPSYAESEKEVSRLKGVEDESMLTRPGI